MAPTVLHLFQLGFVQLGLSVSSILDNSGDVFDLNLFCYEHIVLNVLICKFVN